MGAKDVLSHPRPSHEREGRVEEEGRKNTTAATRKARIGLRPTGSAYSAGAPRKNPTKWLPESPRKIRAGLKFQVRNPAVAAASATSPAASPEEPPSRGTRNRALRIAVPPAMPSIPSMKLNALTTAVTHSTQKRSAKGHSGPAVTRSAGGDRKSRQNATTACPRAFTQNGRSTRSSRRPTAPAAVAVTRKRRPPPGTARRPRRPGSGRDRRASGSGSRANCGRSGRREGFSRWQSAPARGQARARPRTAPRWRSNGARPPVAVNPPYARRTSPPSPVGPRPQRIAATNRGGVVSWR